MAAIPLLLVFRKAGQHFLSPGRKPGCPPGTWPCLAQPLPTGLSAGHNQDPLDSTLQPPAPGTGPSARSPGKGCSGSTAAVADAAPAWDPCPAPAQSSQLSCWARSRPLLHQTLCASATGAAPQVTGALVPAAARCHTSAGPFLPTTASLPPGGPRAQLGPQRGWTQDEPSGGDVGAGSFLNRLQAWSLCQKHPQEGPLPMTNTAPPMGTCQPQPARRCRLAWSAATQCTRARAPTSTGPSSTCKTRLHQLPQLPHPADQARGPSPDGPGWRSLRHSRMGLLHPGRGNTAFPQGQGAAEPPLALPWA